MIKVLIIDDEPPIRETLEMFLREKGYEVVTSEDGEEGLKAVERERPEIVILDIRLPGVSGLEVLRRIKKAGEHVPVIVITAYHDTETTKQAMKLGAYRYIHKPLDADEFEVAVGKAVNSLFHEMNHTTKEVTAINKRR